MPTLWKDAIWQQFGATIAMLENVISALPDHYFEQDRRCYFIAFHGVLFLDYYLTIPPASFEPQLSFTQKHAHERPPEAIDDLVPDEVYSPKQLAAYTRYCREKCRQLINSIDEEHTNLRFTEGSAPGDMDYSLPEILLYNMRHTQHHAAQLNLLIRQNENKHMPWVFREDKGDDQ